MDATSSRDALHCIWEHLYLGTSVPKNYYTERRVDGCTAASDETSLPTRNLPARVKVRAPKTCPRIDPRPSDPPALRCELWSSGKSTSVNSTLSYGQYRVSGARRTHCADSTSLGKTLVRRNGIPLRRSVTNSGQVRGIAKACCTVTNFAVTRRAEAPSYGLENLLARERTVGRTCCRGNVPSGERLFDPRDAVRKGCEASSSVRDASGIDGTAAGRRCQVARPNGSR